MRLSRTAYRSAKFLGAAAITSHLLERLAVYRIGSHRDPTALADFSRPRGTARTVTCKDGTKLATVSMGEGPAILLAHGYTANLANWALIAPELVAQGYEVVMYDQRGHGESSVGSDAFGIAQLGSDLAAVLEQLDLLDTTVVGHSMGGIGLQSFLLDHPQQAADRVSKVVLLSTLPRSATKSSRSAARVSIIQSPFFERVRNNRLHGLYFTAKIFGPNAALSQVEAALDLGLACKQSTMHDALLPLLDFDFVARLSEITHPTIVICGTEDKVTVPEASRILAKNIDAADLYWLDGAGHVTPFEEHKRVAELIVAHASSSN